MRRRLSNDQRGIAFVFELILIAVVLGLVGFAGYKAYRAKNNSTSNSSQSSQKGSNTNSTYGFSEEIKLRLHQTATIKDGEEVIKFRFTELKPPSNPNAKCDELCFDWLPTILTELEYAGKTYKGTTTSTPGFVDMSFESNGAYVLVPYTLEVTSTNFKSNTATVSVTKRIFIKVELDKPFTLNDGGIAALVPGKTGAAIMFGICGIKSPCIRQLDFYVNDEYVDVPLGFTNTWIDQDNQYATRDGSYIEHDNTRLRLIESDDKTYAKFVFEKIK